MSEFVGFLDFLGFAMLAWVVNRLERLFAISEFIRLSGSQPMSARRLAERFEVSRRTIERDLASLRDAGAPLVGEPGRNGGVVSLDASASTVVALTTSQVTAVLMAVAVAGPDMPYSIDAVTAADTLLASLASNTKSHVEGLRSRIRTQDQSPSVHPRTRRTLEEAVLRGVIVNIVYLDSDGTRTERSVEALGFYLGQQRWFLSGWCELRNAGRIFRLDRIESARLTRRRNNERDLDDVLGWVPTVVGPP